MDAWEWFYALRQKSDTHVWPDEQMDKLAELLALEN